jgi:hypothetical protein
MAQYIDKSALVAEIEKLKGKISDGSSYCNGWQHALRMLQLSLYTLEEKEVYVSNPQFPHLKDIIGKVFGAGNLESWEYDDAEQLVLLAKDEVISRACEAAGIKKPYKDGNQWCILKGENIQEGICGFGDNIEDALVDFLRNIPKIPFEAKEVDLEKEIELVKGDYEQVDVAWNNDFDYIARHFFELGMAVSNKQN